jgi:predicted site-specific integrase-resolvase
MNLKDVCEVLGCGYDRARMAIRRGKVSGPVVQGREWLLAPADVEALRRYLATARRGRPRSGNKKEIDV